MTLCCWLPGGDSAGRAVTRSQRAPRRGDHAAVVALEARRQHPLRQVPDEGDDRQAAAHGAPWGNVMARVVEKKKPSKIPFWPFGPLLKKVCHFVLRKFSVQPSFARLARGWGGPQPGRAAGWVKKFFWLATSTSKTATQKWQKNNKRK